jgi:hypothetical protein
MRDTAGVVGPTPCRSCFIVRISWFSRLHRVLLPIAFNACAEETGSSVLQSTDITTRFSFNAAPETGTQVRVALLQARVIGLGKLELIETFLEQDTLNLILARYALNGTFLGFEKLERQFDFCGLVAGTR